MAMIPPHVFMVEYRPRTAEDDGSYYSYLFDKSHFPSLMGIEMPPIRRDSSRDELALWLEQHQNLPPPTHSPAMLVNTNAKNSAWRGGQFDDAWSSRPHTRGRGYTPPYQDDQLQDDSSEDSFHSSTSSGNKGAKYSRSNGYAGGDCRFFRGTVFRFQPPSCPRFTDSDFDKRHYHGGYYQRGRQRTFIPRSYPVHAPPSYIPPDRFLSHAHLVHVADTPPQLGSDPDKLTRSIWEKFKENQQTVETYKQKIMLWKDLFIFIRSNFPKFGLFLVGSTMSGLGSDSSDVDMCLVVRCSEMDQRNEALLHLGNVAHYLRQSDLVSKVEMIHAKVPILKLKSKGLEVDLNCNNSVGIRNTHLLYCYAQVDWRVRPLVLIVKLWAARHDINDAKRMTVSSYSWVLMVIHYLQCGVRPSVLPCLQKTFKEKFLPYSDINQIDLHDVLPPVQSDNKDSLGKLLIGFLQYYSDFDYAHFAVSVRVAAKISIEECRRTRTIKNEPHQWKYLCIEEPFDLTNTARSVYDCGAFERVRRVIQASCERLKKTRNLDSIFDPTFLPQ